MSSKVQFVAKVSRTKTRTEGDKEYYTYRLNIPKEYADKLQLNNNDYLFVQSAMKAKWYHMLDWKEMSTTWNMLPPNLQHEIQSEVAIPSTTVILYSFGTTSPNDWILDKPDTMCYNVSTSGVTIPNLTPIQQRKAAPALITQ